MRKREDLYEKGNHEMLAIIVKNIIYKKKSPTIFLMRQYYTTISLEEPPSIKYRGRNPQWLGKYNNKYKNLLLSLHKKHLQNICYYVKKYVLEDGSIIIYDLLIKYFKNEQNRDFIKISHIKRWEQIKYKDYAHRLLAFIIYMFEDEKNINLLNLYILPTKAELEIISQTNEPVALNKYNSYQNYYTLNRRRLYGIHENIGSFKLPRFHYSSHQKLVKECWFHWEYYIHQSPLWINRIEKYKGKPNHDKKEIDWENEDDMQEFYKYYGYELDEVPQEIQNMSLKAISKENWKKWKTLITNDDEFSWDVIHCTGIDFPDHFQFTY